MDRHSWHDLGHKGQQGLLTRGNLPSLIPLVAVFDPPLLFLCYFPVWSKSPFKIPIPVTGDRYSGEWVKEAFRNHDIHYRHSDKTKSELYLEALPLFATGTVQLVDHRRLVTQLLQLERRTHRSGKDSVDHPPHGHDDVANAVCGALVVARRRYKVEFLEPSQEWLDYEEELRIKEVCKEKGGVWFPV